MEDTTLLEISCRNIAFIVYSGVFYLSEVRARGLLNFGKKLEASKLGKLEVVIMSELWSKRTGFPF